MNQWHSGIFPVLISNDMHVICTYHRPSRARSHPVIVAQYNTIGTEYTASLRRLAEIFFIIQPLPIPAPNLRVVQDAAPPRMNNYNVAPPRAIMTTNPSDIAPTNK